jgi:tetratricopeptide (TPR) repeat protein
LTDDLLAEADPQRNPRDKDVTLVEVLDRAAGKVDGAFPGQPGVEASVRTTIGVTYNRLGLAARAEPHLRKALDLYRGLWGEEDADSLNAEEQLGICLGNQGKLDEAEQLRRHTLEAQSRVLGRQHPETLQTLLDLSSTLQLQGKPAEAVPLLRERLQLQRESLPAGHKDFGGTLCWLGCALAETGQAKEGEALLGEGLTIQLKSQPKGRWGPHYAESMLGGCLTLQGRYAEAEPLLLAGYESLRGGRGVPPTCRRQALERIVTLYETWGKPEKAARWRARRGEAGPPKKPDGPKASGTGG